MVSERGAGGGLQYMEVWELDENGLLMVPASQAEATIGKRLDLAKAFTPNFPDPQLIQFSGDDLPQGFLNLSATELASATLRTGVGNLEVDAILTGTKVATVAGAKMVGRETDRANCLAEVFTMAYQKALNKDKASQTYGAQMYHFFMLPLSQVRPSPGAMEEGNAGETTYNATPQKVNRYPWGLPFVLATDGYEEAAVLEGYMDGPPVINAWMGDAALTAFDFSEAPLVADDTGVIVAHYVALTGAISDVTSTVTISATGLDFTTPGAPAADDLIFAFFASGVGC